MGEPLTEARAVRTFWNLRLLERLLWGAGLLLLLGVAGALAHRALSSRIDLARFDEARAGSGAPPPAPAPAPGVLEEPAVSDFSLWAPGRIKGYQESLAQGAPLPLAVLEIPRLNLRVAVLEGTDEVSLNRGLGHIAGTALPGQPGNVGLAGHRDGFFRCLQDIRQGDRLRLVLVGATEEYEVVGTRVVAPTEVSVLAPTPGPTVTLVTCYPFYFVGSAPQRFIVTAAPCATRSGIPEKSRER